MYRRATLAATLTARGAAQTPRGRGDATRRRGTPTRAGCRKDTRKGGTPKFRISSVPAVQITRTFLPFEIFPSLEFMFRFLFLFFFTARETRIRNDESHRFFATEYRATRERAPFLEEQRWLLVEEIFHVDRSPSLVLLRAILSIVPKVGTRLLERPVRRDRGSRVKAKNIDRSGHRRTRSVRLSESRERFPKSRRWRRRGNRDSLPESRRGGLRIDETKDRWRRTSTAGARRTTSPEAATDEPRAEGGRRILRWLPCEHGGRVACYGNVGELTGARSGSASRNSVIFLGSEFHSCRRVSLKTFFVNRQKRSSTHGHALGTSSHLACQLSAMHHGSQCCNLSNHRAIYTARTPCQHWLTLLHRYLKYNFTFSVRVRIESYTDESRCHDTKFISVSNIATSIVVRRARARTSRGTLASNASQRIFFFHSRSHDPPSRWTKNL